MALCLLPSEEKIIITLNDAENREQATFFDEQRNISRLPIYTQQDTSISGVVRLNFADKSMKHMGLYVQLVGETQNYHSQDKPDVFFSQVMELESAGKLKGTLDYPFTFSNFTKKYETYYGIAGKIKYYIKAVIVREFSSPIETTCEFAVQLPILGTLFHQSFEIQLRIADYLMINVQLNKTSLNLEESLIGKILVEQIRIMIKKIMVSIIRREITNPTTAITCTKEDIVYKKELLDKCPKKGDAIPFKINLAALDIAPCLAQSNPKMNLKYVLIMSFIDAEDRSLFKPIELNIVRKR